MINADYDFKMSLIYFFNYRTAISAEKTHDDKPITESTLYKVIISLKRDLDYAIGWGRVGTVLKQVGYSYNEDKSFLVGQLISIIALDLQLINYFLDVRFVLFSSTQNANPVH